MDKHDAGRGFVTFRGRVPSASGRAIARWWPYGLMLAWAFAEATVWPIMPDAILVPLAVRRPGDWWRLVLASALGSALGGAVSYRLGRRPGGGRVTHLPLVRAPMAAAVARWLADEGAWAGRRQPASGVPFKVFARLAGAGGVPIAPFLAVTVAGRSLRFGVASGVAALLVSACPTPVSRALVPLTLLWWAAFGVALWRIVRAWEGRDVTPVRAEAHIDETATGAHREG